MVLGTVSGFGASADIVFLFSGSDIILVVLFPADSVNCGASRVKR